MREVEVREVQHREPAEGAGYEVADIVRQYGAGYRRKYALTREEARALRDIEECRTAALGGQAILTFRSLIQSDRWPAAWHQLSADFRKPIALASPPTLPLPHPDPLNA